MQDTGPGAARSMTGTPRRFATHGMCATETGLKEQVPVRSFTGGGHCECLRMRVSAQYLPPRGPA